jgi:nucleoid DNA-binding protein
VSSDATTSCTSAGNERRVNEGELVNKKEMVEKLARKTGLTKTKASEVIEAIFSSKPGEGIIAVELDAGRKVEIAGFGKFGTRSRSARKGHNPATGEEITIAATKYAFFKPATGLRRRVAE